MTKKIQSVVLVKFEFPPSLAGRRPARAAGLKAKQLVKTELIETDADNPQSEALERAAEVIRRGGIVALPSDSLYVLAADPFNLNAVARVFRAKGREPHRSLPLLIDSLAQAEDFVAQPFTERFHRLARKFWPGPLTLIVPASTLVPLRVTGNTGRLALRQSASSVPNSLIRLLDQPIIATSANRSGQPTCRSGIEIFGQMDGRVDLILDAGSINGLGATTVDITEPRWRIIREGAIQRSQIEACLAD